MPREWKPMRLFVREDGRFYPTVLFWLFFFPILTIIVAGCLTIQRDRRATETAAASLTEIAANRTEAARPTATGTATPEPSETPPPPTPTEFVYSDPSTWELVERTDIIGTKYFDPTDSKKNEVWRAFQSFYDSLYRAQGGLPSLDTIEDFVTGPYLEYLAKEYYSQALESGVYEYYPSMDTYMRFIVLENDGLAEGRYVMAILLLADSAFPVQFRNINTGEVEREELLERRTLLFDIQWVGDRWKVTEFDINLDP